MFFHSFDSVEIDKVAAQKRFEVVEENKLGWKLSENLLKRSW